MAKAHEKQLKSSFSYIAILSVIAIVVFLISSTQKNLEVRNQIEQKIKERAELMARGIHPDPISIRQIPLDYRWNLGAFSYQARAAYLMSDVADFGDRRTELEIGSKNKFLAVEIDVAYVREMGAKQDVLINRYVKVATAGRIYQPVSADTVKLGPDQNATVFVLFAVPMTSSEFTISTNNKSTKVDFSAEDIKTMQGVFTQTYGFSPTYE